MNDEQPTMTDHDDALECDIAGLLSELAGVQGDLLVLLSQKRERIAAGDGAALAAFAEREQALIDRLQACQQRRQQLLDQAAADGLPADSIHSLAKSLPAERRSRMQADIEQARHRSRILQHDCLTNWVLVQRTLLHLSQLIEIIATGGRMKPTYGNGSERQNSGSLVDRAV
jgi:flagellar biosynthesis/type III secretory pathway chaperone